MCHLIVYRTLQKQTILRLLTIKGRSAVIILLYDRLQQSRWGGGLLPSQSAALVVHASALEPRQQLEETVLVYAVAFVVH